MFQTRLLHGFQCVEFGLDVRQLLRITHAFGFNTEDTDPIQKLARRDGASIGSMEPGHASARTSTRSSEAMRSKTPFQLPGCDCRKSRMVGYQGLSSRSSIHRQSGAYESATQTLAPSAPARWAIAVSDVTIRSNLPMIAAVSRNAPSASGCGLNTWTANSAPSI